MTRIPSDNHNIPIVLTRLRWMHERRIWPNGLRYFVRYLWTDAFGVVLLVSLYHASGDDRYLDQAEWVVGEVDRVLGRPVGIRIGEASDRDGQYFHYLAMWMFALGRLGVVREHHRERAVALARAIHSRFVVRRVGVIWKMLEELSGPYPGVGSGPSMPSMDMSCTGSSPPTRSPEGSTRCRNS